MIAYAMLYAAAVGLPILLAAIACSAALRRSGRPERGVWLAALGLAVALPVAFLLKPFSGTSVESFGVALSMSPDGAAGTLAETGVLGLPAVVIVPVEQAGPGLDEALLLAWLLASVVLGLRWAVAAHRLNRVVAPWRAGTVDGTRVWLTSDLGPAVSGIFRTRILVPSWLVSLPREQRSLVLLHEEEHVGARDPVLMAVCRIARIVVPWNPVLWLMSSRLMHAVELDCDRRVLSRRPDIGTYGDTLLTVSARDPSPLLVAAAFAESEVPLRKRIIAMTTPPRTMSALGISTVLALGVVLLIGACEVPIPRLQKSESQEAEAQADVDTYRKDVLRITVARDGSLLVNGAPTLMEDVSAVVAPLIAADERALVISIGGDRDVPYGVVDELQKELVAAGVRRVVFEASVAPRRLLRSKD